MLSLRLVEVSEIFQVEEFQGDLQHLAIRTIDFSESSESMHTHTRLVHELVPGRYGLGRSDLCFVIDAPLDSDFITRETGLLLYLDDCQKNRQLKGEGFQVVYQFLSSEVPSKVRFHEVVPYLRGALLEDGFIGSGLDDFLAVLGESSSRQLQFALITCADPWAVPEDQLKELRFRTLYACLFGGGHLSLGMYAELLEVFERLNPGLAVCCLGMKIMACSQPVLLLLGEPER